MKFQAKYPDATPTDRFEFEYSYVTKVPGLGPCRWCSAMTKWFDVIFQQRACSEECLGAMWRKFKDDQRAAAPSDAFDQHFAAVKEEMSLAADARVAWKDIIIVVRDQPDYFRECLQSIMAHTSHFHLYIWDNGSGEETRKMIEGLAAGWEFDRDESWGVTTARSEANTGFIAPNNELAGWGDNEYIVLLNSDTKVFAGWDRLMTGFLDRHPDVSQVGYWGGHMGADGRGFGGGNGYDVDYIPGWCFCISRDTYERHGLFSPKLSFAYCEDADLSLRLKEAGGKIYSLHAPLVHHYQNKTIKAVEQEGEHDVAKSFRDNHEYIKNRWQHYLANERVLLKRKDSGDCHGRPASPSVVL
jgi:GT2 family glycosyltransferase